MQCNFTDCDSAFQFFLSFKADNKKTLGKRDFEKAVDSLSANRFKKNDIEAFWRTLTENGKYLTIDKYLFRRFFDNISYTGCARVSLTPASATTIVSAGSSSAQWETDIFEKIRAIARSSSVSFEDIFKRFDEDGNGAISLTEFRNAIRKLSLGLSSREIDKLMSRVDTNSDGKIDYREFAAKFKPSELDERLKERAKDKLARLKELMILHMTSPADAFRLVTEHRL